MWQQQTSVPRVRLATHCRLDWLNNAAWYTFNFDLHYATERTWRPSLNSDVSPKMILLFLNLSTSFLATCQPPVSPEPFSPAQLLWDQCPKLLCLAFFCCFYLEKSCCGDWVVCAERYVVGPRSALAVWAWATTQCPSETVCLTSGMAE